MVRPILVALLVASAAGAEAGPVLALYLPPVPPALGTVIAPRPAAPNPGPADAAPAELASYIGDPFYVALSVQLKHRAIGSELAYALDAYLTTKTALLTELRARLDSVRESASDVRAARLRTFAADQTPRIVALEATAERLRQSVSVRSAAHREFLRWQIDSMGVRGAKNNSPGFDARQFEVQTAMMVATFGDGPNAAQRRWLRELANDAAEPGPSAGTWAFSPEGSRVSLTPSDPITPELTRQIADYTALRQRLLADVRSALSTPDRFDFAPWIEAAPREAAFAAELETRAEAIRTIVVKFKDPAVLPQVPTVPSALGPQLARYRAEKAALQKQLLQCIETAKGAGPSEAAPDRIRQAIADFTSENQARYAALEQSRDQLLGQLGDLASPSASSAAVSSDALSSTFNQSLKQLKTFWEYRDYQNAVFQPGLSPEQRRLLFDGALIKLQLPLPGALRPVEP